MSSRNALLLEKIMDLLTQNHSTGGGKITTAFVCDLDSTLFDTRFRSFAVFQAFATEPHFIQRYPKLCSSIKTWTNTREIYDPIEFVHHHSPQITISPHSRHEADIRGYWKTKFFHPDWLQHDQLYPGAQTYLHQVLENSSCHVIYLSARSHATLWRPTIASLQQNALLPQGFTSAGSTQRMQRMQVRLKLPSYTFDHTFKHHVLRDIRQQYERVVYIENEPYLIHQALEKHPSIHSFFYRSVHSVREPTTHPDLSITLTDWGEEREESSS